MSSSNNATRPVSVPSTNSSTTNSTLAAFNTAANGDPRMLLATSVLKAVAERNRETQAALKPSLLAAGCAAAGYVACIAFGAAIVPAAIVGGVLFAAVAASGTQEALAEQERLAAIGEEVARNHPEVAALATEQEREQWVRNVPQPQFDALLQTLATFNSVNANAKKT
jgi:hypothetical protein